MVEPYGGGILSCCTRGSDCGVEAESRVHAVSELQTGVVRSHIFTYSRVEDRRSRIEDRRSRIEERRRMTRQRHNGSRILWFLYSVLYVLLISYPVGGDHVERSLGLARSTGPLPVDTVNRFVSDLTENQYLSNVAGRVAGVGDRVQHLRPPALKGDDQSAEMFAGSDFISQQLLSSVPQFPYSNRPPPSSNSKPNKSLPKVNPPPKNAYLPDSAWPTPHRTGYAQGSTDRCAPTKKDRLTQDFLQNVQLASDPINLLYTADDKYIWGVSWTAILKISRQGPTLKLVDYINREVDDIFSDVFHGAYSVLSAEGVFYTAISNRLEAYADDSSASPKGSKIKKLEKEFLLPRDSKFSPPAGSESKDFEVCRALCMTYDGYLAVASSKGRVAVFDREVKSKGDSTPVAVAELGESRGWDGSLEVSNNIACDEEGGIYVVSDKLMHKLRWYGGKLTTEWEEPYDEEDGSSLQPARLGAGSGSTPSLMGDSKHGRFVVITDASLIMNVVVMDAENGEVMDKKPVTFGLDNPKTTLSEQSVLVSGWRFVVVNNTPKDKMFASAGFQGVVSSGQASPVIEGIANAWPVIVGDAPYGVEQFEFNPKFATIRTVWTNPHVSIPNGIPSMSTKTNLMYGIGKRPSVPHPFNAGPLRGIWTMEALDWDSGESVVTYNLGVSALYNSVYAATEIGADCEIITGTLGGVIRVRVV